MKKNAKLSPKNGNGIINDDFYYLSCLHSFRTKNKLELHKKLYESKDFCNVVMPSEDIKILQLDQYQKFETALFIIYVV